MFSYFTTLLLTIMMGTTLLFDFTKESSLRSWNIVDDGVMGGLSQGQFKISEDGHGVFYGKVSLENNGGFSSVQHYFKTMEPGSYTKFVLYVKGDGKAYQFRAKASNNDYYSYIGEFKTTGTWQIIEIPFDSMYPAFRGRTLNQPNYDGRKLSEVAFLIGNKRPESFRLEIDKIEMQ